MEREPQPLVDARFLLLRAGGDAPPSTGELTGLRDRLAAMRAHPSCSAARAAQLSGVLVVLDVLLLAAEEAPVPSSLAG